MPHITEELWQKLKNFSSAHLGTSVMVSEWPRPEKAWRFPESEEAVELLKQTVGGIRDVRARFNIPPKKLIRAATKTKTKKAAERLQRFSEEVKQLTGVGDWTLTTTFERTPETVQRIFSDIEIFVYIEGAIDVVKERARMEEALDNTVKRLDGLRKRLTNERFIEKAPEEVVEGERVREKALEALVEDLELSLASLRS